MGKALGDFSKKSGLDRVGRAGKQFGKNLGQSLKEVVKYAAGITALGAGLFGLVKSSASVADEIAKTADKLGVGIVALQRLEHRADLAGVATQQMRDSLRFLLNAAGEAAEGVGTAGETFTKLGISVEDGNGKIKDAETLMGEIADAMDRVTDESKKVSIAQDLFGRSGAGMINVLRGGSKAMREAGDEAERLGVISEAQARASEEFNDNFARLSRVITHVGHALANELLPYLNTFVLHLKDVAIESRPEIIAWFKNAVIQLRDTLPSLVKGTWGVISAISTLAAGISYAIETTVGWRHAGTLLVTLLGGALVKSLIATTISFVQLGIAIAAAIPKVIALASAGLTSLAAGFATIWPMLVKVVASTWAWTAALLANPITWIVIGIVAAVAAVAAAAYLVYQNWDEVVGFLKRKWNEITSAFDAGFIQGVIKVLETFNPVSILATAVNALVAYFFGIDLYEIGQAWIGGFIDGVAERWQKFTAWLGNSVKSFLDLAPDSFKESFGLGSGAPVTTGLGASLPSALGSQNNQIGGKVIVGFENMPRNARIKEVRSDSAGFGINVDAGYSMVGP
jgi:hypothetical protein